MLKLYRTEYRAESVPLRVNNLLKEVFLFNQVLSVFLLLIEEKSFLFLCFHFHIVVLFRPVNVL